MDDETTLRLLEQLVSSQPGNWEARGHLARLHLGRGDAARAEEVLTSGPPLPEDVGLRLLLGDVLSRTDPARAIVHFQEMVRKDKRCARAYLGLARIYRERGMREEARQSYSLATVLDESLEDPAFRAWLDGEAPPAAPERPAPRSRHPEDQPEEGESSEFEGSDEAALTAPDPEPSPPPLPPITFRDVGGMDDVKERIRMNIIYPAKNPALFQKFKKRPGGGILLYGPPGCGKTYLARATAGECGATFMSVGITDVLSKWIGESERRLHELFDLARRRTPSVLFMDELDALGMSRQDARGSAMTTVINQLLTELDGIQSRNESLMILAATNAPWSVDSAFRRPGRFDRVVFVPPPDEPARRAVFEIHLRDLPHETPDLDKLAKATRHFSGADIRAAVELASEHALTEEMKTGRPGRVTLKSLLAAVKETRPSTLEWLETARNYASYANRAGQYDDLVRYFEQNG